jgi:hypothetical protein
MPKVQSINQNLLPDALPNFRNLGATLRIVLLVNSVALLAAIAQAVSVQDIVCSLYCYPVCCCFMY